MLKDKRVKTSTSVYSDVGKVRKANEDSYYVSRDENLIVVCDGMGGQVAGGLASKIAVETLKDIYENLKENDIATFLYDNELDFPLSAKRLIAGVRVANRRIFRISKKNSKLRGMGTTVVALSLDRLFATMAHVGDSRIYRINRDRVLQLTEDHSWLNELIEDKEINEEQIETFAQKNVITRAMGTSPTIKIDIHCEKFKKNDVYLLCTDGLHTSVGKTDIGKSHKRSKGNLDYITRSLAEKALKRDGSDNITLAVARVNDNSKETKKPGISITLPEEGSKISSRIDKFVLERYSEPKMNINNNPIVNTMSHSKFYLPGIIAIIGLVAFLLGIFVQGRNSRQPQYIQPPVTQSNVLPTHSNLQNASNGSAQIQRSIIGKDAVLAVVLFNSTNDYKKAKLNERGTVIENIAPFSRENDAKFDKQFNIFMIDSESNVLYRSEAISLPGTAN